MKYSIDYTNRFKKSLRKSVKRGLDSSLIETAVGILATEGKLPAFIKLTNYMEILKGYGNAIYFQIG